MACVQRARSKYGKMAPLGLEKVPVFAIFFFAVLGCGQPGAGAENREVGLVQKRPFRVTSPRSARTPIAPAVERVYGTTLLACRVAA